MVRNAPLVDVDVVIAVSGQPQAVQSSNIRPERSVFREDSPQGGLQVFIRGIWSSRFTRS